MSVCVSERETEMETDTERQTERKRENALWEYCVTDSTPCCCGVTGFPEISWNLLASMGKSELQF